MGIFVDVCVCVCVFYFCGKQGSQNDSPSPTEHPAHSVPAGEGLQAGLEKVCRLPACGVPGLCGVQRPPLAPLQRPAPWEEEWVHSLQGVVPRQPHAHRLKLALSTLAEIYFSPLFSASLKRDSCLGFNSVVLNELVHCILNTCSAAPQPLSGHPGGSGSH